MLEGMYKPKGFLRVDRNEDIIDFAMSEDTFLVNYEAGAVAGSLVDTLIDQTSIR